MSPHMSPSFRLAPIQGKAPGWLLAGPGTPPCRPDEGQRRANPQCVKAAHCGMWGAWKEPRTTKGLQACRPHVPRRHPGARNAAVLNRLTRARFGPETHLRHRGARDSVMQTPHSRPGTTLTVKCPPYRVHGLGRTLCTRTSVGQGPGQTCVLVTLVTAEMEGCPLAPSASPAPMRVCVEPPLHPPPSDAAAPLAVKFYLPFSKLATEMAATWGVGG